MRRQAKVSAMAGLIPDDLDTLLTRVDCAAALSEAGFPTSPKTLAPKRLTENELSDFSRLWHDGCVEAIIEAQDVDRNHSTQV